MYVLKCAAATACRMEVFPARLRCNDSCGRRLLKGRKFETLGHVIGGDGDQRSSSGGVLMGVRWFFLSAADWTHSLPAGGAAAAATSLSAFKWINQFFFRPTDITIRSATPFKTLFHPAGGRLLRWCFSHPDSFCSTGRPPFFGFPTLALRKCGARPQHSEVTEIYEK